MMLRSHSVWVVPVAATLIGFGPGAARVTAQTIDLPFEADFESITTLETTSVPFVFTATDIATSDNAPFGLTQLKNVNFAQLNPTTGAILFGPDPTAFGLQGPISTGTFSGQGSDQLFVTFSGSASVVSNRSSATINIIGGEGRFSGASGTLQLLQEVSSIPPIPPAFASFRGRDRITGTIRTPVPEPGTIAATLGVLGVVGINFLLRRRNGKVAM